MKKFLSKTKRGLALLLMVIIAVTTLAPTVSAQADSQQFTVKVKVGYDGKQEADVHVPVTIEVTNSGADFNGTIRVTVVARSGNIMYEQALTLAQGATKKVTMAPEFYLSGYKIRVSILNSKGKTVFVQDVSTNVSSQRDYVRVGILSDDSSLVRMLDKQNMEDSYYGLYLTATELTVDQISENAEYMDSLDVLVISNFSTDVLSEKQISAIMNWAANGGLLIIGTGDSYKKSIAGFEDILEVKDNGLKEVKTNFAADAVETSSGIGGQSDLEKIYDLLNNNISRVEDMTSVLESYTNESAAVYGKLTAAIAETLAAREDGVILEEYFDTLWDECAILFADYFYYSGLWGSYNTSDLQDFTDLYYQVMYGSYDTGYLQFKRYCQNVVLPAIAANYIHTNYGLEWSEALGYIYQTAESYYQGQGTAGGDYDFADATIWDFEFGEYGFSGVDQNTGDIVDIFRSEEYGDGYVMLAAMDFTKKPFTELSYNGALLADIIYCYIGSEVDSRYLNYDCSLYNYGSSQDSYVSTLLSSLQTVNPVPVIVYLLIFAAYIAACFIMYNVLKKKKKSLLLWPFIGAMALGVSLLVFFVSFTSKPLKPVLNVVRVINADDESDTATNYCAILLPKSKKYTVTFGSDAAPEIADEYDYDVDYSLDNDYTIGFSEKDDGKALVFNNKEVLSNQTFVVTDSIGEHGSIEFTGKYSNGTLTGSITNNYGCDLTDCCILIDACVVPIGKFKNGETINLSTLTPVATLYSFNYPKTLRDNAIFGKDNNAMTIMLGVGGNEVVKKNSKINAVDYVINKYNIQGLTYYSYSSSLSFNSDNLPLITTSDLYFVGFNDRAEGITDSNVTENVTEAIVKEANR